MPRKKRGFEVLKNFNTKKSLSSPRSYIILAYGAITVIVLFIVVFLGIKALSPRNGTIDDKAAQTAMENARKTYTVVAGDSLWTIAQNKYNNGYAWTEIAKVNNLPNPDSINTGDKLILPSISPSLTPSPTIVLNVPTEQKITGNSYTVVQDDNLWNIAVRAYGDGFKWETIAKANKLANPDLIHSGNKLTLPR